MGHSPKCSGYETLMNDPTELAFPPRIASPPPFHKFSRMQLITLTLQMLKWIYCTIKIVVMGKCWNPK